MLINEELGFNAARPIGRNSVELVQEGHLSLAARWPGAKSEEEPHSLHPVTRMWTRVLE